MYETTVRLEIVRNADGSGFPPLTWERVCELVFGQMLCTATSVQRFCAVVLNSGFVQWFSDSDFLAKRFRPAVFNSCSTTQRFANGFAQWFTKRVFSTAVSPSGFA